VRRTGLIGAAVALSFTDIVMAYLVLKTSLRQLQEKLGDFVRAIFAFPVVLRSVKAAERP